jgi:hypothetical protein
MFRYVGKLKKGLKFDKKLRLYLESQNINIVKYLRKVEIVIFECQQEISLRNIEYFEAIELERNNFTI